MRFGWLVGLAENFGTRRSMLEVLHIMHFALSR